MASPIKPRSARQQAHGIVRAPIQPTEQPPIAQSVVPIAQPAPIQPTQDHARRILEGLPDHVMSMDSKADAWDAFYQSHHSQELAAKLANIDMPVQVKQDLYEAKKNFSDPVPTPMDRAVEAIHRVSNLDPNVLEIAESHPHILGVLMNHLRAEE